MTRRLRASRPATVIHGKLVRLLKLVFLGTFVTVSRVMVMLTTHDTMDTTA